MATNFYFTKNDKIVTTYLTVSEIESVTHWQSSFGYTFEFHDGHPTGNPIYFRPDKNDDTKSMPKIDTKNVLHGLYGNIANEEKLTKGKNKVSKSDVDDITNLITNEWATLKTFAQRYWSGTKAPVELAPAPRLEYECTKCKNEIIGYVPEGEAQWGKYKCPKCGKQTLKAR